MTPTEEAAVEVYMNETSATQAHPFVTKITVVIVAHTGDVLDGEFLVVEGHGNGPELVHRHHLLRPQVERHLALA